MGNAVMCVTPPVSPPALLLLFHTSHMEQLHALVTLAAIIQSILTDNTREHLLSPHG